MRHCLYASCLAILLGWGVPAMAKPAIIKQGPKHTKAVALTFDDGPKPEFSGPILDILQKYKVQATFFVVGTFVNKYPDVVHRMALQGHTIANHTHSHQYLPELSPSELRHEIDAANTAIRAITQQPVRYFRPPGGQFNATVIKAVQTAGLTTILWDINAGDHVHYNDSFTVKGEHKASSGAFVPAKDPYLYIANKVRSGSIILMHNSIETIEGLPKLIEHIRQNGYTLVTVDKLLN